MYMWKNESKEGLPSRKETTCVVSMEESQVEGSERRKKANVTV